MPKLAKESRSIWTYEEILSLVIGKYNSNVITCAYCNGDLCITDRANETIGYAEKDNQVFVVYRCPHCYEIMFHHGESKLLSYILLFYCKYVNGEIKRFKTQVHLGEGVVIS